MTSQVKGIMHLLMQVSDLDKAEKFYVDLLGFTVRKREPFPGGRDLIVTNQGLGLTQGGPGDGRQVEHFAFEVDDVQVSYERVKQAGVKIIFDIKPNSYGKSMYIADPDGNKIELIETPKG
jgi:catechol 2,3-dioxygenase-like lactoylglutathione lyase family enzyme